ncbi:MAG: TlpA family protein disulfide reductase [Bryobacteraceae bacterium]|nr:TlpA family protein disulfide reductase [Bryobacteraceae bacterium]
MAAASARNLLLLAASAAACLGQQLSPEDAERDHFNRAMAEAGTSPIDYARALEQHLEKYPETPRRPVIERSIVQAAMEARDHARLIRFGERVLTREPDNFTVLERVTRALLRNDAQPESEKALVYARQYEATLRKLEESGPPPVSNRGELMRQLEMRMGKALLYQARAAGNLGKREEAVELARRSYQTSPTAESAREAGRWLSRLGRDEEAIRAYAEAFAIADPDRTDAMQAADRARMNELYLKHHDSEAGLGDLILEAWDRAAGLLEAKRAAIRKADPNYDLSTPSEFVLSALEGESLKLSSLRGKVVVADFWATWCQPCRAQQPLYEEAMAKYEGRDDVVFLNINSDQERDAVNPFLETYGWSKKVYFEDGLQRALNVSSIPTTIIFDKRGEVASRIVGFIPDRFVDMLTERIDRILREK